MTRKTRRELERAIENLGTGNVDSKEFVIRYNVVNGDGNVVDAFAREFDI